MKPVYTDGGDTLYVMDQVSDKKNREENWVENLALQDAVARLSPAGNSISLSCGFLRERPRWRWRRKSASPRRR